MVDRRSLIGSAGRQALALALAPVGILSQGAVPNGTVVSDGTPRITPLIDYGAGARVVDTT